jgi:hypothetical protein
VCDETADKCIFAADATWYDRTSNLTWDAALPLRANELLWQPANEACAALTLCGHDDWRLPTISELRSFIRGCPMIELGGTCTVGESCTARGCRADCPACTASNGPNAGSYMPMELQSSEAILSSSTSASDDATMAWVLLPLLAKLEVIYKTNQALNARCVRTGR